MSSPIEISMIWGWPISDGYTEPGAVRSANPIAAQTVSQSAHEAAPAASLADPGLHSLCRGSFVADVRAPAGSAARTRPTPPLPNGNRNGARVRHHCIPHPRHPHRSACGRVRPARRRGPKIPPVFRTDLHDARPLFRVCAGHRPAVEGRDDRLMRRHLDTPTGYMKRAPAGVSTGHPFQHVVAGEGFEPSKLSRWIYRPTAASP